jgi:hypothetical protein
MDPRSKVAQKTFHIGTLFWLVDQKCNDRHFKISADTLKDMFTECMDDDDKVSVFQIVEILCSGKVESGKLGPSDGGIEAMIQYVRNN